MSEARQVWLCGTLTLAVGCAWTLRDVRRPVDGGDGQVFDADATATDATGDAVGPSSDEGRDGAPEVTDAPHAGGETGMDVHDGGEGGPPMDLGRDGGIDAATMDVADAPDTADTADTADAVETSDAASEGDDGDVMSPDVSDVSTLDAAADHRDVVNDQLDAADSVAEAAALDAGCGRVLVEQPLAVAAWESPRGEGPPGVLSESGGWLRAHAGGTRVVTRVCARSLYDLRDRQVHLRWQANNGYMGLSPLLLDEGWRELSGTALLTTSHTFAGSTVVSYGTWYFSRVRVDASGMGEIITAERNYDTMGGRVINTSRWTATPARLAAARVCMQFNDNYAGTEANLLIGQLVVGGCYGSP